LVRQPREGLLAVYYRMFVPVILRLSDIAVILDKWGQIRTPV